MFKLIGTLFVLVLFSSAESRVALPVHTNEIVPEFYAAKQGGCQIDVNKDLNEPQPLILIPGTTQFLLPNDTRGIVFLNKGEQIEVYCSKTFDGLNNVQSRNITCESGNEFRENGKIFSFKSLNCTQYPYHKAERTNRTCFNDARVLDVGFDVGTRFVKLYEICFDEVLERTYYVTHEFTPPYATHQSGFPRPSFISTGYFNGKKVDNLYTRKTQRQTVAKILKSTELAEKYIQDNTDLYLARGHISAKSDFIFGAHHRATFYFMNCAPQWQTFNGGNWQMVEIAVKKFVADRNIEVDAYTGTWGTTTLPDAKNKKHELYLAFDENNNGLIPVPMLYYKILVDRKTQNGITLIGVNNPYLEMKEILADYVICKDISDMIDWVNWNKTNIQVGYSYACDVNEFMGKVKHLPDLRVKGLLV
ncbi:uncharacterized protein LOC134827363 [Culicoides brevitarsis]|uniref:uncharacterized protein LOC134827363 n=1 Tax=Culicoides brevitarsis TaxID=469753 RepID=UPI00307C6B2B